jgi:tetratricopeptide (TPR) repeat protein
MATLVVYGQVGQYEFVSLDDGRYVYENTIVREGISFEGIRWAFGFTGIAYWHPLTWLSHMLDCELFGLDSGRHHTMNLILHLANSLLLFFIFRKMTAESWKSAMIALLFAVHPINVESVAWVAERKSVLSTLFWMLTLLSYFYYTVKPEPLRYTATIVLYALGLLAKPAIITLPFVLLLIDFWPLGRLRFSEAAIGSPNGSWLRESNIGPLTLEKLPFFVLTGISIYLSYLSSRHHGIVIPTHEVPLDLRLANGLVSYMIYLGKMIWPQRLAVFYPYPEGVSLWLTVVTGVWIICMSIITLRWARRWPYLVMGWFWYLGTLVPHLGLMQAGLWPALADRWAYIPFIGLFIMISWGVPEAVAGRRHLKSLLPLVCGGVIVVFTLLTWNQTGYWRNNIALYGHAVEATRKNDVAHNNLGAAYFGAGQNELAIFHFVEALKIQPGYEAAHRNLNRAMGRPADMEAVIVKMHHLLKIYPEISALHYNLGNLYRDSGQYEKALEQYRIALELQPEFIQALNNQAGTYIAIKDYAEGLRLLKKIAQFLPDDPGIRIDIARLYADRGQTTEAVRWLNMAVEKGFDDRALLKTDRHLKLLQGTPEYQELLNNLD